MSKHNINQALKMSKAALGDPTSRTKIGKNDVRRVDSDRRLLNLKLRVPRGFFNLLEMFTRDLLQHKPTDVFQYAATYFESLIWNRTLTGHDPSIHGAICMDHFVNVYPRRRDKVKIKFQKSESEVKPGTSV